MKKVLIIVHDVPGRGGSRFAQFVRHLPRFGYEPIVLTIKVGADGTAGPAGNGDGPCRVYRTWSLYKSPFRVFSRLFNSWALAVWFESLFFIPDLFITWLPSALWKGYRLVRGEGIDLVVTSSPPESLHLIGLLLKRLTGIRWIADFQDLWTTKEVAYHPPTPLHDLVVRRLEKRVYGESDHIIANTRGNERFYRDLFAIPLEKVTVIPNGHDGVGGPLPPEGSNGRRRELTIGYMGFFDKDGFPWKEFLLSMARLRSTVPHIGPVLHIAGHVSQNAVRFIERQGLAGQVVLHGELRHAEAFRLIGRCDLLLVLMYETPYSKAIVPHKLYYYLAMSKPVLAIAEEGGEVADIVRTTNAGRTVSGRADGAIERALREYCEEWRERGSIAYAPSPREREAYDYRRLTEVLAHTMDRTLSTS